MSQPRAWSVHLAVVGLTLMWFGCGGGNVPDPGSDANAANETTAAAPGGDAAPGAKSIPAGAKAEAEAEPAAAPAGAGKPAAAELAANTDEPKASSKGDSSGTAELLNLSNNAAAPAAAKEEDGAAPKGAGAASGMPGTPGMMGMGPGGPGMAGAGGYPGASGPGSTNPQASRMPGMAGMPGGPGAPGSPGGYPGAPGGPGGPGGPRPGDMAGMPGMGPGGPGSEGGFGGGADDKGPANFDYPATAARAFLAAVRAKDRDKLAEAVALRSSQEASTERMKKLFASVLDQSISDEQLADIAKNLEGFQIVGMNDPKSTGRIGVILGKSNNQNGQFRRTLMLRKEAKGWKVADVGAQGEMEAQPNTRGRGTTTKRR